MINVKEIYVLNLALGGNQIFSLPSFSDMKISNLLASAIVDSLIAKKILIDEETFSEEGLKLVKKIDDFKKSTKYIKFGSFIFGLSNNNTAVLLTRNFSGDKFSFERIDMTNSVSELLEEYPFLDLDDSENVDSYSENITYDDLISKYNLNVDNSIYLSTFIVTEAKTTDEIIFYNNNKLYLYDRKNNLLEQKNCNQIKELLNERLGVVIG